MKELSIEQKAKAYDKALERMKSWVKGEYPECFTEAQKAAEFIFPELKESEDERMWKLIKKYVHYNISDIALNADHITREQLESWLEKQGEEPQGKSALEAVKEEKVDNQNCVNPTDKNEPEFHGGEWVIYNHDICQIVKREEGCNKLVTVFGIEKELVNERNLSTAHLWTIQDAKDGDVLVIQKTSVTYESIFIFNKIENDSIIQYLHYFTTDAGEEVFKTRSINGFLGFVGTTVHPATKEQRDLLFQKMTEAGYEWDADKKELKKIEDEPENYKQQVMSEITDLVKDYISQKPTWNEEDEKKLSDISSILSGGEGCYYNSPILIGWLKSLKERIGE